MAPTSVSSLSVGQTREAAAPIPSAATSTATANTTTISTIAVQSGKTRIVIAIMRSGPKLSIKILELEPGIAHLGTSFDEAAELQSAHNDVIKNLQSKQNPVEDLLRQADDLIANQKPKAEVYTAMAESLGLAWRDLNSNLDLRKGVLDQNFNFQGHYEDYKCKVGRLESLCRKNLPPRQDVPALRSLLCDLGVAKRAMLESSVYALQEGEALLEKLRALWQMASLDSRQGFIKQSAALSIGQVELWLEELHDRRVATTNRFQLRLQELQNLLDATSDLAKLEAMIADKKSTLSQLRDLGCSVSTCDELIKETMIMQTESQEVSDRSLEAVRSAQSPSSTTENSVRAFAVLERSAEYQRLLDVRLTLLTRASDLFNAAQNANYSMDQMEMQVRNADPFKNGSGARECLETVLDDVDHLVKVVWEKAEGIFSDANDDEASGGVRQAAAQVRSRADNIRTMTQLKKSQASRGGEAVKSFVRKLEELDAWIGTAVVVFLKTQRNLGTSHESARLFLEGHRDLVNRIHMKTFELEGLRGALKTVADQCSNEETKRVEARMDDCNGRLTVLMRLISQRLTVSEKYVKFQKLFEQIYREMEQLEAQFATPGHSMEKGDYEESRLLIQQLFLQVCQLGKNASADINAVVGDDDLDKAAAVTFIEECVGRMNQKQSRVIDLWKELDVQAREGKILEEEWTRISREKRESVDFSVRIDGELFPVVRPANVDRPEVVCAQLEERLTSLPRQKVIADRFVQLVSRVEEMKPRLQGKKRTEAERMLEELRQKQRSLQVLFGEYELILQMLATFFKNYGELDQTMRNLVSQYKQAKTPDDVTEAELMAREHEAGRTSILEILRFARGERDAVIKRMDSVKSRRQLQRDRETLQRLLETFESDFETIWSERKRSLTRHAKFCLFAGGLNRLSQDMHELHETLRVKTSLGQEAAGPSVSAARNYMDALPKVLSDLEQRLRLCAAEGEEIAADMPAHQATIKMGLNQAEERWTGLNSFIRGKRETMSAAGQYFDLLDESDRFLKDSSRILFEWSRRVSILNSRKDALNVKAEIERYIKAHKSRQSDLLIQLSSAAGQVFGNQPVASRLKSAQKEQTETFDALQTLLTRLDQFFSQQKNFDDEGSMNRRIQAETEANIKAAKAEAEAARRAAREAEESRRAAEEITLKAMRREVKVTKVICHETQTEGPRPHMAPDEPKERRVAPLFTDYLQDTVLTEGSRCLMKATVTGVPTPAITWFKDGVPVQKDNLDYNASFDIASGLCSLMIEETFVEDSANWSLRASNQAGYAESHAKLTVKEAKTIKAEFAPRITVSIKDGCADEGGQFEFKCRVEGTPAPATSWFKNGVCIDRSRNYTAGENDGGDCVLRIDKVYLEDGAEFALRAFNKLGSVSTSATLTVQPSEPIEMPTFDEPLPNLEVAAGHHILLECLVGGSPRPELQWSHNGKILRKNPTAGIDLFYEGNRAALKIGHAFLKYAGQYVCKARNIAGEATSTSSVTVKPITVETSDNEAAVENEFKPAFQVPLENMTVAEGDDCTLECVIVGRPEPEVTWYRNGIPIRDSPFHQFRTHGEVRKLILKGVDTISEGEYMVKVANDKGECQSTCSLRVMPAKVLIPISTQTSETNLVKTKPKKTVTPKFISQVQGKMAEEGEKAVFEGIIDGVPECKITWLYNSHPVRTSPDVRIQFENKMTTLTISKVRDHHSGQYTCLAENMSGSARSTADLVVRKKLLSPVMLRRLQNVQIVEGQRFVADIEVGGTPIPKVTWFKDGARISTGDNNCQLRDDGCRHTLIIQQAKASDSGVYSVEAINDAGTVNCQATFTVSSQPSATTELGPESRALKVLSAHRHRDWQLPDLLPFPYRPDERPARKRNYGKVPKPSQFVRGEMYFSDYETDLEGHIAPKWKSCNSDNEGMEPFYRRMNIKMDLGSGRRKDERRTSPPCPHKWESHEDIEKLEMLLKKPFGSRMTAMRTSSTKETVETSEEVSCKVSMLPGSVQQGMARPVKTIPIAVVELSESSSKSESIDKRNMWEKRVGEEQESLLKSAAKELEDKCNQRAQEATADGNKIFYQSETSVRQRSNMVPPAPPMAKTVALTPSPPSIFPTSPINNSVSSHYTVVKQQQRKHVTVFEKVKLLEQKVEEDYLNSLSYESAYDDCSDARATPTSASIRPEEIPGAVRVFPLPQGGTPSGSRPCSRKGSLVRGSSVDSICFSPLTVPRNSQKSPLTTSLFVRNAPPPMYIPPPPTSETSAASISTKVTELFQTHKQTKLASTAPNIDTTLPCYRKVEINLPENGTCQPPKVDQKSPTPPTEFERPEKADGTLLRQCRPNLDKTVREIRDAKSLKSGSSYIEHAETTTRTRLSYSSQIVQHQQHRNTINRHHHDGYMSDMSIGNTNAKSCTTSASSTMDRSFQGSGTTTSSQPMSPINREQLSSLSRPDTGTKTPVNVVTDSEIDDPMSSFPSKRKLCKSSPRLTPDRTASVSKKANDGYEADTDDTLTRRRKSVRDMALSFQEAENACPSARPLRPKGGGGGGSESEYESDVERKRSKWSRTPEPVFTRSRAYMPPKWGPGPGGALESQRQHEEQVNMWQKETKVIRFNRKDISSNSSLPFGITGTTQQVFNLANKREPSPSPSHHNAPMVDNVALESSEEFVNRMAKQVEQEIVFPQRQRKQPPAIRPKPLPSFHPTKFVPGPISPGGGNGFASLGRSHDDSLQIKAKWVPPSDSETEDPSYRNVMPTLPSNQQKARVKCEFREMSDQFKSKGGGFVDSLAKAEEAKSSDDCHNYHNVKQSMAKGRKQIDTETGLIYFKYDFGYEFGIVVPTEDDKNRRPRLIKWISDDQRPRVREDVTVRVELDPSVSGPECGLQWFGNGQPVIPDARHVFESDSLYVHSLVLRGVATEDNGEYSCTVVNRDNSETRSCCVTVEGESLL